MSETNNTTTALAAPAPTALDVREGESSFYEPESFKHLQRVAKLLAESELVPQRFRGKLADCTIALDIAKRLGANPLAVLQSLYTVHGNPGWSAQWIIACLNTCGRFEPLRFEVTGTGDARGCIAWSTDKNIRLPAGVRTLEQARKVDMPIYEGPPVTIEMAKKEGWMSKNGSKWQTMPDLMLRYRAATFFGRLYAPELLMGMKSEDEIIDIGDGLNGNGAPLPGKALAEFGEARTVEAPAVLVQPDAVPAPEPPKPEAPKTPQQHIEQFLGETGVAFDDFRQWCETTGLVKDSSAWAAMNDVPTELCEQLRKDTKLLLKAAKIYGKPAA